MSLLEPLVALLPQGGLPRTGWLLRGVSDVESVADHVLGVAQVALAVAPRVAPPLDLGRVLAMALVHDLAEVGTGDLPKAVAEALPPGVKAALEERFARPLAGALGGAAADAWDEYARQATREARFVKLCDRLQLGVRLVGYERAGRRGLDEFRAGLAGLDAGEFEACRALLAEILEAR